MTVLQRLSLAALLALLLVSPCFGMGMAADDSTSVTTGALFGGGVYDEQSGEFAVRLGGVVFLGDGWGLTADTDIKARYAVRGGLMKYWNTGAVTLAVLMEAGNDFVPGASLDSLTQVLETDFATSYFSLAEGLIVSYRVAEFWSIWAGGRYVHDVDDQNQFTAYGQFGAGFVFYPPARK